ncbi:MAG: pyridoxine 5'-phosphate synthase, partial [Neisseria sp.]|nr:pyridoxine 5'-phosphate synthase [Neisseria sp.]
MLLGVNIDHIATVRNARASGQQSYPPITAAE